MARKLATIVEVSSVEPIPGADAIEVCSVLGWKVVARKGDFKKGDKAVYCECDSLIPKADWSSFLFKGSDVDKPSFRLRTIKLRGQISQGLLLPMSALDGKKYPSDTRVNPVYPNNIGSDVGAMLGITKYEAPIPAQLAGKVKGAFPSFIPKTDETRVQAIPEILKEIAGKQVVITVKMDGSSGTFYNYPPDTVLGVCSRNLEFVEDEGNTIWKVANVYKLKEKFAALSSPIAIQGEVCGPGIQKNKMCLKDHDLYVFNVLDIKAGKYLNADHASDVIASLGLKAVPVVYCGPFLPTWTIDDLLKMAEGVYSGTDRQREGIVIRPLEECRSEVLKGRMSFKVINNKFLLENKE